jgi:DNA gyrase subunit A
MLDLPHGKLKDKGIPVDNVSNYSSSDETIVYACALKELIMQKLCFATKNSMLKHVYGTEFDITKRSVAATGLNDGDEVIAVFPIIDERNIVLRTKDGYFLKFPLDDIPLKKKGAVGVRGMKLVGKDEVTDVYLLKNGVEQVIEVNGKKIELNKLKLARRDAKGTKVRT